MEDLKEVLWYTASIGLAIITYKVIKEGIKEIIWWIDFIKDRLKKD